MPKFIVHAQVMIPVFGFIEVEAENEEAARRKALEPLPGGDDDEWSSRIWNDGDWVNDIRWSEAEDFRLFDVVPDPDAAVPISAVLEEADKILIDKQASAVLGEDDADTFQVINAEHFQAQSRAARGMMPLRTSIGTPVEVSTDMELLKVLEDFDPKKLRAQMIGEFSTPMPKSIDYGKLEKQVAATMTPEEVRQLDKMKSFGPRYNAKGNLITESNPDGIPFTRPYPKEDA